MVCRLIKRKWIPQHMASHSKLIQCSTLLLHIKDGVDNFLALTDEDISVAKKPHFLVPFPQDPDFVPRPAIQAQISEQLAGQASRLALFGMGGFGYDALTMLNIIVYHHD